MKIILNEGELMEALRHAYPTPAGYQITDVGIQRYSTDFCTLELTRVEPAAVEVIDVARADEPLNNVLPLAAEAA